MIGQVDRLIDQDGIGSQDDSSESSAAKLADDLTDDLTDTYEPIDCHVDCDYEKVLLLVHNGLIEENWTDRTAVDQTNARLLDQMDHESNLADLGIDHQRGPKIDSCFESDDSRSGYKASRHTLQRFLHFSTRFYRVLSCFDYVFNCF